MEIPHNYIPREYQAPLFSCLADGFKRGVAVWHRRAGKDKTALNLIIKEMHLRVGVYYYFFPTFTEGRRILWDGIGADGMPFLDHFPPEIIFEINKTEMKIKSKNGSLFQVIGTDGFDKVRGPNPVGCVFSEYSVQDPRAWDIVRPILAENDGWAIFLYTPRGRNHGWDLYNMAIANASWFCQLLTVEDTKRPDGSPVIRPDAIDEDRRSGMPEDMVLQEYYCSFSEGVEGAYYAQLVSEARKGGRIRSVLFDSAAEVHTAWDLGFDDANTIWFFQVVGPYINFIDYFSDNQKGLGYYMSILQDKKDELGYYYGEYYMPHDIEVHDLSQPGDLTRKEYLEKEWRIKIKTIPRIVTQGDGIHAVRWLLPKAYFDENRCVEGIKCLENYRKEWDAKHKVYRNYPLHDWASHGAKAAETAAFGLMGQIRKVERDMTTDVESETRRVEIFGASRQVQGRAPYGY
jgi:hypothetical protein